MEAKTKNNGYAKAVGYGMSENDPIRVITELGTFYIAGCKNRIRCGGIIKKSFIGAYNNPRFLWMCDGCLHEHQKKLNRESDRRCRSKKAAEMTQEKIKHSVAYKKLERELEESEKMYKNGALTERDIQEERELYTGKMLQLLEGVQ